MNPGKIVFNEPKKRLAKLWEEEEKEEKSEEQRGEDKDKKSGEDQEKLGRLVGRSEKLLFKLKPLLFFLLIFFLMR